jgi:hypothetical protein
MDMPRVQIKRGVYANLPTAAMLAGEEFFSTDQGTLHVATGATTRMTVVPAVAELATIGAIDGAADFLMLWDASNAAQKAVKVTFNDFKTALNIPAGASDEKAAIIAGGQAGYIWGTDGTNGLLRMNSSLSWTKDASNAFVTIAVNVVDCGTF